MGQTGEALLYQHPRLTAQLREEVCPQVSILDACLFPLGGLTCSSGSTRMHKFLFNLSSGGKNAPPEPPLIQRTKLKQETTVYVFKARMGRGESTEHRNV